MNKTTDVLNRDEVILEIWHSDNPIRLHNLCY